MKETLYIEHFGPIPLADIEIKRVTVFIGSQGSGKSTIAKLLTIFRDHTWRCSVLMEKSEEIMRLFSEFSIDKYFTNATYIKYCDPQLSDIIEYKSGKFTYTSEGFDSKQLLEIELGLLNSVNNSFAQKLGYSNPEEVAGKSELKMMNANSRTSLYIPAERVIAGQLSASIFSILTNRIPLSSPVLEYLSFFEKAKKEFSAYTIPFLSAKYMLENGEEKIEVISQEEEKNVLSLKECSSGLQTVIPLLMVLEYCSKLQCFDAFVLEEPELNLFPTNQQELLKFIFLRYNNITNLQTNIVLTTHSPYILSILNNYLYAAKVSRMKGVDKEKIQRIIGDNLQLEPTECAVYSFGKKNEQDPYCVPVISKETNLIDYNYLDAVSMEIGDTFDQLQLEAYNAELISSKK